ncbi:MAG TPA: lactate utilization protein LutB domain-containing protein, partial [Ktedonobacteraceae bacterium]|nr:lactate utilization protein LutB domain-containing protein [Ktedonobacteraceae bacterium]
EHAKSLPYASTLCGACYEVCPVSINIPEVLLHLRGKVTQQASPLNPEALAMRQLARVFASPKRYEQAQRLARRGQRFFMHGDVIDHLPGMLKGWTTARDLAPIPKASFRDWWRARQQQEKGGQA